MKKQFKKIFFSSILSLNLLCTSICIPYYSGDIKIYAHSGRTDASGGHNDNKNASGLGSYHYHCGGYPAHLHTNGYCPYSIVNNTVVDIDTALAERDVINSLTSTEIEVVNSATAPNNITGYWSYETYDSLTGFVNSNAEPEHWCFKYLNGTKHTGWLHLNNTWYYMNEKGWMLTGWQQIGQKWYYLDSNGSMLTGWKFIGNDWYFFNSEGQMLTGWYQENGYWYYLDNSGRMVKSTAVTYNGVTYTFDASGKCLNP